MFLERFPDSLCVLPRDINSHFLHYIVSQRVGFGRLRGRAYRYKLIAPKDLKKPSAIWLRVESPVEKNRTLGL